MTSTLIIRNLLEKMSMSSFKIANAPPFDEDTIGSGIISLIGLDRSYL
jgi:hypothetical protein